MSHNNSFVYIKAEKVSADMGHFRTPVDWFGQVTGIR